MHTPAGFSQEIPDEAFRIGTGARPLSRRRATIQREENFPILWSNGADLGATVFAPPKTNIIEKERIVFQPSFFRAYVSFFLGVSPS